MRRILFLMGGVVLGVALIGAVWLLQRPAAPQLSGMLDNAKPAPDFTLTTADNAHVRLSDYRGKVVLLYFGYTFCPDVCPTTLTSVKKAFAQLGALANQAQFLMVTVDPERDTADRLTEYVHFFDPRFVGLTGSPEDIAQVAKSFGASYAKEAGSAATGYLMSHTARISVIDVHGLIRQFIPFEATADDIATSVRYQLSH